MSETTKPSDPWIAMQVVMMPADANPLPTTLPGMTQNTTYATIFGGDSGLAGCLLPDSGQRLQAPPVRPTDALAVVE